MITVCCPFSNFSSFTALVLSFSCLAERELKAKTLYPVEWRNVGDDYHAARSLYMLMRYEKDRNLLNKYRMSLNRHWEDWKTIDFEWESNIWFLMVYGVLTGEDIWTEERKKAIKDMWGFERKTREFRIPTKGGGTKTITSAEEGTAAAMIIGPFLSRSIF